MGAKKPWVATVLIETKGPYFEIDNNNRLENLLEIIRETSYKTTGAGVVLLPAGYFNTGRFRANLKNCRKWIRPIKKVLNSIKNRRIVVCFGVDGRSNGKRPIPSIKDQIAIVVDRNGVLAVARKFHPTKGEKGKAYLAKEYLEQEENKSRIFKLSGKKFYIAVCYDVFGIRQRDLINPGVDGILNPIHRFTARCECEDEHCTCGATSGDTYFARHGLAGASKQWMCPTYGSVFFMERKVPEKWPSGVLVNRKKEKMKTWSYKDNAVSVSKSISINQIRTTVTTKIYF